MTCTPFQSHDHAACIDTALSRVEEICAARKLQFTPVRRQVLGILLGAPKAQGAYDILARMSEAGAPSQPPAAYRALEFLVGHGFAHRLEKRNAYVACPDPGDDHVPSFLICEGCDRVAETADPTPRRLSHAARSRGFVIERTVIEALGRCPNCATQP